MEFNLSDIEALQKVLCPDDSEVKVTQEDNSYSNYQLGSALTPSAISGSDPRKELAPPNARIEAKVNRGPKPAENIWTEDEINTQQVRLKDDRPEPEYEILYQQKVGTEDVFLGLGDLDPSSTKCQELLIKIHLPGSRMADISLDVEPRVLKLQAPKFALNLGLPHTVLSKEGNAKWDSKTSKLMISLPIDKEDIPL